MPRFLTGFVDELRRSGVPVSMVEAIDAGRALEHVDLGSRSMVKAALSATMVKNSRHLGAFDAAFEIYFSLLPPPEGSMEGERRTASDLDALGMTGAGGEADLDALVEALFQALRDRDSGRIEAAIRRAVTMLAGMEPGRPVGGTYYLYRVLRGLGLEGLRDRLFEEMGPATGSFEERLVLDEIDRRLEDLRVEVRAEIRRRLVADRGPEEVARTLRRPPVEEVDLVTATREDLAAIEAVVHPLTRRLATRLARQRRPGRQGRLDFRRTLRRSLSTGGVPVDPRFRRPRPEKPEILVLADISGSVATFARFTMQLVFAVQSQLRRVRSFAFIDGIDEVTGFFGPGTDFGDAMRRIGSEAAVVWMDGHSDYGHAFGSFVDRYQGVVGPRTTVIVAGDARTNYHDPNQEALGRIAADARALYWLNPEAKRYWDTGDSVMGVYSKVCDEAHEVRNLRQLSRFVEQVALPSTRPVRHSV